MNGASVVDVGRPVIRRHTLSRSLRGGLKGGEYTWAVAFVVPYIAVFLAFVVYPVVYGLWMGSEASLYRELFADPIYQSTVVNTILYLALGVNVKMFLALLLSGFFMRPGWWMKALLLIFVLPWAVPQISTFISIHWMLNGEWGFLNNALYTLFHIEGPSWLNDRWSALGAVIVSHIWKFTPFWTLILLAGRMAIPLEISDSAKVDGAAARVRPHHLSAARQPLPDLHAALDDFPARRLQRRHLRLRGRAGELDARAGDARHPQRLRHR
jgi:multiple sugar transport system permease protein